MQTWAIILYGLGISGGANVIFNHAYYASQRGVQITFLTKDGQDKETASWHKYANNFKYRDLKDSEGMYFDVLIATEWKSAFDAYVIKAEKYFYFVQSIESRFFYNQDSLLAYVADMTYEMDFKYITEATWIKDYLKEKYHRDAVLVLNGIDKDLFERKNVDERAHTRFLVEGSVNNWLKNVPRTIELCSEAGVKEIWLVTPDEIDEYPGVSKVFSKVDIKNMAEIYSACDVLVKLSLVEGMFGPPLEMFHCGGTAITYDIEGSEEYLIDGINALVVCKNDEAAVINVIRKLSNDKELLEKLKSNAKKTALAWPDWEKSSKVFFETIENSKKISNQAYKNIVAKGKAGANAYRNLEKYLGMEPYKNNIEEAIKILEEKKLKLFIYGAGYMCKSTILLFSKYDYEISGILVSNKQNNPNTVMGHKVIECDKLQVPKDEVLVYITSEKYRTEIEKTLLELNYKYVL